MKIAIIGYGRMGKEIERVARLQGMETVSIDSNEKNANFDEISSKSMENVDVCIDFTAPAAVIGNIRKISKYKKNIVVGTTGWNDRISEVREIVGSSDIGLIYSSNFSVGVNAFFRVVENAAKIFDKIESYDVYGYELHHSKKLDSPSGTAKAIGEILLKNMARKNKLVFDKIDRKIDPNEVHIASVRSGSIPGTHVVGFDSSADTIELKHEARSREGFAQGALTAAKWIQGKNGFYTIDDMMNEILGDENV